jgi:hypothetical protein
MQETRRKRIVIDLDPKAHARTMSRAPRRRWPKVLGILGLLAILGLLLAAAGGYFWWKRYQTTPAYSLASLVFALDQGDNRALAFDQFVDSDKIIENVSGQVTEKAIARYGSAMNPAMRQRLQALIPGLLPRVREQALESVRLVVAEQMGTLSQQSGKKPFFVVAVTLPYAVDITTEGDTAKVTTTQGNRPTELILTRAGDRWKVTNVKNDAIVQRIVERLMQDLPPIGAPPGEPPERDPFRAPRRVRRRR